MTGTAVAIVPVCGTPIMSLNVDGSVVLPMKQVCDGLGLPWEAQRQRIQKHPILAKGTLIIQVPSPRGEQDQLCLPLKLARAFFLTVQTDRIRDEAVRAVVLAWQEESFDAVDAYWSQGVVYKARALQRDVSIDTAVRAMLRLFAALKAETNPEARQTLHASLTKLLNAIDVAVPLLTAFDTPAVAAQRQQRAILDLFWERYDWLAAQPGGDTLNLHRVAGMIAISLPDFESRCARANLALPAASVIRDALKSDPSFTGNRPVNSAILGRAVQCWIFDRTDTHSTGADIAGLPERE